MKRERPKPKSDPAFQKLVDQLWENDVDRIDESGILSKHFFSEILIY